MSAIGRLQVKLARVYVAPHERMTPEGKLVHVAGYARDISPIAGALERVQQVIEKTVAKKPWRATQYAQADNKVRQVLDRPQVRVRISMSNDTLAQVLDRGRYVSALEEEPSRGKPTSIMETMRKAQKEVLGDIQERPVYGFLSEGHAWEGGVGGPTHHGTEVVLKPEAKRRSMVFFGDSAIARGFVGSYRSGTPILPMPYHEADHRALINAGQFTMSEEVGSWKSVDDVSPYVEAWVLGGVSVGDIEKVRLAPMLEENQLEDRAALRGEEGYLEAAQANIRGVEVRRRLSELGIPWEDS